MPDPMRKKLRKDEVALGVSLTYPNPNCIESLARGWDWVWIDGQHGQLDYQTILHCVQVAELTGVSSLVRVPGHSFECLGPILDTAANAVMVPMVNTAEEARQIVRNACFPPLGSRSYGGRRVVDRDGRDYYLAANRKLLLVCQIETPEAVENAGEIASVEGVGGLFFGAEDLRIRLGIANTTPINESKRLVRIMEKIAGAARNNGKVAGNIAHTAQLFKLSVELGYRLIRGGADIFFLTGGSRTKLQELREILTGFRKKK